MMKVFIDCEFVSFLNNLRSSFTLDHLISIGCVAETGQKFYAEHKHFDMRRTSYFVQENVLPLLDRNPKPALEIAQELKLWVEGLNKEVEFVSDAPGFDFPFFKLLFDQVGWPKNCECKCKSIGFKTLKQEQDFIKYRDEELNKMRQHHALDDAIANRIAFLKVDYDPLI